MKFSRTSISSFQESSKAVSVHRHGPRRWITMQTSMASRNSRSKADTPYKVVTLESWEEYLSFISDSPYQNWAFRGQRDASAPLFSALSRYFMAFQLDPRAWPEHETRILRIFKRKAIHFLQHFPDRSDDFQRLALTQDHVAPPRLL